MDCRVPDAGNERQRSGVRRIRNRVIHHAVGGERNVIAAYGVSRDIEDIRIFRVDCDRQVNPRLAPAIDLGHHLGHIQIDPVPANAERF